MGYQPPARIALKATIATQRGESRIWSCRSCGSTICITHNNKPTGACPGCTMLSKWHEVHAPVSTFVACDEATDDAESYDGK